MQQQEPQQPASHIPFTQEQITKALGNIRSMVNEDPNTCIDAALRALAGKYKELVGGALRHFWTIKTGVWKVVLREGVSYTDIAKAVAQGETKSLMKGGAIDVLSWAISDNPELVLRDPSVQTIATMPEVLSILEEKSNDVVDVVIAMTTPTQSEEDKEKEIPASVSPFAALKPFISSVVKAGTVLLQTLESEGAAVRPMLSNMSIVIDPQATDEAKSNARSAMVLLAMKNIAALKTAITPELWKSIGEQAREIVNFAASNYGLPKALISLATALTKDVASIMQSNTETVHAMIDDINALIGPGAKDEDKMKHLFSLLDQTIMLAKSNPQILENLRIDSLTIADALKPYMPVGIDTQQVVNILLKTEVLSNVEKAYTQYKAGNTLSAVATLATSWDLLKLAGTAAVVFIKSSILNYLPDFIRRTHVKEGVNEKLEERGEEKDLKILFQPSAFELDPIRKHTFNGCFKGLKISHNLNDFIIDGFDFRGTRLGVQPEKGPGKHVTALLQSRGHEIPQTEVHGGFSLANTTVSNSNFKGVMFKGEPVDLTNLKIDAKSFETLSSSILRAQKEGKIVKLSGIEITGQAEETTKAKAQLEKIQALQKKLEATKGKDQGPQALE